MLNLKDQKDQTKRKECFPHNFSSTIWCQYQRSITQYNWEDERQGANLEMHPDSITTACLSKRQIYQSLNFKKKTFSDFKVNRINKFYFSLPQPRQRPQTTWRNTFTEDLRTLNITWEDTEVLTKE